MAATRSIQNLREYVTQTGYGVIRITPRPEPLFACPRRHLPSHETEYVQRSDIDHCYPYVAFNSENMPRLGYVDAASGFAEQSFSLALCIHVV
jgi:hypothetical protein